MQTPAGKECRHYHQDFHRGRNIQECRLVQDNPESLPWTPHDCGRCPVPEILQANASQNLRLKLTITSSFLGIKRQVEVSASCSRHHIPLDDPYIGCPLCNDERPGLDIFRQALDQRDDEE